MMVVCQNLQVQTHFKYCIIRQQYIYKAFYVQIPLIPGTEDSKSQTRTIILVKQVCEINQETRK